MTTNMRGFSALHSKWERQEAGWYTRGFDEAIALETAATAPCVGSGAGWYFFGMHGLIRGPFPTLREAKAAAKGDE